MANVPDNTFPKKHPYEEQLERYAMNLCSEEEREPIEEHLLACGPCQEAIIELDEWTRLMKAALPEFTKARPVIGSSETISWVSDSTSCPPGKTFKNNVCITIGNSQEVNKSTSHERRNSRKTSERISALRPST